MAEGRTEYGLRPVFHWQQLSCTARCRERRACNVTFEPRCRNNWHIHHKSVQVLVCVAGRGWYVEEGKEPVVLKPGVVIAIPAEAKHWHGAAKDSWMQHITYMTKVEEGSSTTWLEPIVDEEYNKLP